MTKSTILLENIAFSEEGPVQPEDQDLTGTYQSLKDEVEQLKGIIANLEAKVSDLEATQDSLAENELNMLRLIADLRKKDPGRTELSRAEKIVKYLEARPDHRATYETLKGHLGVKNDLLNDVINVLMAETPGKYSIVKDPGDKRKRSLVMLARY